MRTGYVLVAEDNPGDVFLLTRRLELRDIHYEVVESGPDALEFLQSHRQTPPCMVFLDVRLPRLTGPEVLRKLEGYGERRFPVVAISTSDDPADIRDAYRSGAQGYLCKEMRLRDYDRAIDTTLDYWLEVARRPA